MIEELVGLYSRFVLPRVVHLTCSAKPTSRQRQKIVPSARGRVLEVGIGSGLNLPFYEAERVERVFGLDPSPEMTRLAAEAADRAPFEVEFLTAGSEEIPLEADAVDTVVMTYTLCTIPHSLRALREMVRVLKPGGRLLFCEHGLAPDDKVRRWQNRINPIWRRIGGGCYLNRDIPALLVEGGFRVEGLETMYIPGWRPASFNYWGRATAA
jgi:ubiquinone/menaquinone biosynthesis C-methylase UbiE